jgi:single-strand DNA-binding protein
MELKNKMNICIIEGRVANSAELLYTKSGNALCKFDLATEEHYKTLDGDYKTVTSYITVSVWGKYGESCKFALKKGEAVRVTGSVKQNNWEDKNGNRHSELYVVATTIDF